MRLTNETDTVDDDILRDSAPRTGFIAADVYIVVDPDASASPECQKRAVKA